MKIKYLFIKRYKNLVSFEVFFKKNTSLFALAGKNGSGKSNVLEAIAKIFACVMSGGNEPDFIFTIKYIIHGDLIHVSNETGSIEIVMNGKTISKAKQHSAIPMTIFLYYAGETERLKNIAHNTIDKVFDQNIKKGETPSYKSISYLSTNDFGLSLLVNRCFGIDISKTLEDILSIESISKKCRIILKRPSWGQRGKPENFWNAIGYIKEILELLSSNGLYQVDSSNSAIITLQNCEDLRDDLLGPEGLYKSLKILMQADILERVEIDVIKDGESFDCNELSEGEKQLGNLLSIMHFTRDYSSLFLLDEFDSYLHPTWQRVFAELVSKERIAGQMIFTTHSPLTLSKMEQSSVFLLKRGRLFETSISTFNRDASEIMEELMEVSLRPEYIEDLIMDFNKSVAQKKLENARKLREELSNHLTKEDPFFITADISIARLEQK